MDKKELPSKMFYSITEVAQYYDVNESLLRYWEKEFPLIAPKRSDNKRLIRSYTPKDIENIGIIYYLLKEKGLTISGAKEALRKNPQQINRNYQIVSRLRAIRNELSSVSQELAAEIRRRENVRKGEEETLLHTEETRASENDSHHNETNIPPFFGNIEPR